MNSKLSKVRATVTLLSSYRNEIISILQLQSYFTLNSSLLLNNMSNFIILPLII